MFCSSCGKEIADDAVVCIGCGRAVNKNISAITKSDSEPWSGGIYSLIIIGTLLIPYAGSLLGLIFGIIGISKEPKRTQGFILIILVLVNILLSIFMWGAILGASEDLYY